MTAATATHAELIRAAAGHATRISILAQFATTPDPLSPVELADTLGQPLGDIAYHVRILRQADLLTETHTTPRRGALTHHYRPNRSALRALHTGLGELRDQLDAIIAIDGGGR